MQLRSRHSRACTEPNALSRTVSPSSAQMPGFHRTWSQRSQTQHFGAPTCSIYTHTPQVYKEEDRNDAGSRTTHDDGGSVDRDEAPATLVERVKKLYAYGKQLSSDVMLGLRLMGSDIGFAVRLMGRSINRLDKVPYYVGFLQAAVLNVAAVGCVHS